MSAYIITTDAGWNLRTGKAAFAFQIKRDHQVALQYAALITCQVLSPTEAELMAIGHAVHALRGRKELGVDDVVYIYTDCAVAVRYLLAHDHELPNRRLLGLRNILKRMLHGVRYRIHASEPQHFALKDCHNACKRLTSYE